MPATIAEQRDGSIANPRDRDRDPHAGTRGIVPVVAARSHVERIDMPVLATDEDAAAGDRGLSEHRNDAGNAERPFQIKPLELRRADAWLALKPPVLDVCPPAVERRSVERKRRRRTVAAPRHRRHGADLLTSQEFRQ
jgi:hypothetical protein